MGQGVFWACQERKEGKKKKALQIQALLLLILLKITQVLPTFAFFFPHHPCYCLSW